MTDLLLKVLMEEFRDQMEEIRVLIEEFKTL